MNATEDMLDQLHSLTQKRAAEIMEQGKHYQLANTERTVQGLANPAGNSIKFLGTQMIPGQILSERTKAGTVEYFVTSVVNKAGCQEADVLPVIGYGEIFKKHLTPSPIQGNPGVISLKSTASRLPILKFEGNELSVPKQFAAVAGRVIKTGGSELEAINVRFDGCKAILQVRVYVAPVAPAPTGKTAPRLDLRGSNPAKFYGSYFN